MPIIETYPQAAQTEPFSLALDFVLDVLPDAAAGNYVHEQPRLTIDGVEVRIQSYSYQEAEQAAGSQLTIKLVDPADRSLFASGVIKFGLGKKTAGVWDEASFTYLVENAVLGSTSLYVDAQTWTAGGAADIVVLSNITDKLGTTAETDLVIYDSNRVSLSPDDFDVLLDTAGNSYPVELLALPNLTLYDILSEIFVNRCGFSAYHTNLPNFRILRLDCQIGQRLFDAVAGLIGMFEPVAFEQNGETWLMDSTMAQPPGFPEPQPIDVSGYTSLSTSEDQARLDGFLVQYVEDENNYDFTDIRFENATDTAGDAVIDIHRIYIRYFKNAQPHVPIREALNIEEREVTMNGVVSEQSTEVYTYDNSGNLVERRKTVDSRLPDLGSSPQTYSLQRSAEEHETFIFQGHPFQSRRQYCAQRHLGCDGLITIDSANQQLGQDFEREFKIAYRSGNLEESQTTRYGHISTRVETSAPLRSGQIRTHVLETDDILGVVKQSYFEERAGDISIAGVGAHQKRILVLDSDAAVRSTDRIETLHGGEVPVEYLVPLARRKLTKRKTKGKKLSLNPVIFNGSLVRGMTIMPLINGSILGTFIILGRTVSGDGHTLTMQLTAEEI